VPQSSAPDGRGWPRPGEPQAYAAPVDDGWGPATAVYGGGSSAGAGSPGGSAGGSGGNNQRMGRAFTSPAAAPGDRNGDDGWSQAGPLSGREQRAARAAERRTERSVEALRTPKAPERGLPWWAAMLLLIVIAGIGGLIDTLGSIDLKGGFNFGIVAASVIAILAVKRSHMFPIVIAPPIVYSAAAISQLYIRSGALSNRKVVLDAAANYLVYGFPAIAAATAAVLIIAGLRLIVRK